MKLVSCGKSNAKRAPAVVWEKAAAIVSAPEKKGVRWSDLDEKAREVFGIPGNFGRYFLKQPLTDPQVAVCNAFLPPRAHVSAIFCNEAGKTTKIIPTVTLWHIMGFPRRDSGGVTATSGSWSQIKNQLMPALRSHASRFPNWEFLDREIKRGREPDFMCYSTVQAGRAEGFHGSDEHPLLMWFDECKSVPDSIIRAGEDRCRPQRMGLLSSTGFAQGKFYESHHSERHYWSRFSLDVDVCPWIDRKEMRRIIERAGGGDYERGLQDPIIQSAYFNQFMPFVEGGLISLADIEACLADPPGPKAGERHAFCDFAVSGDSNVLAVRVGNRVWIADKWRQPNTATATMESVGRFIAGFVKLKEAIGLRPEEIEGDSDGVGRSMSDRIRECGWPILDFFHNSTARDPQRYLNRGSENWFEGCKQIQNRQIILCDDNDLKIQLADRVQRLHSSGKMQIESKKDLFARQARAERPQRSPDEADAVLGALAPCPRVGSFNVGGHDERRGPWPGKMDVPLSGERELEVPEEVLAGFDAGG